MQVLSELMPESEVLSGVRNACLLIDPSCGTANYNAAMTGQAPSTCPVKMAGHASKQFSLPSGSLDMSNLSWEICGNRVPMPCEGVIACLLHRSGEAICAGAKAAPPEAVPVLLAVRMGRYLSGPGHMPVQALVPVYLELLEELSSFAAGMSSVP